MIALALRLIPPTCYARDPLTTQSPTVRFAGVQGCYPILVESAIEVRYRERGDPFDIAEETPLIANHPEGT